jgi:hypothetical protein
VGVLGDYVKSKLPAPPACIDVRLRTIRWTETVVRGDCTIAGVRHLIAAWNIELGVTDSVPGQAVVMQTYLELRGGQDSGLNEDSVLATWRTQGLLGAKVLADAPVDIKDLVGLYQAVACYGGAYLGIACPELAKEQFQANQPWTCVKGPPIEGGQCIVALGSDDTGLLCATWGGVAQVTFPFLARCLDEAWAIISDEFVRAGGGPTCKRSKPTSISSASRCLTAQSVGRDG